MAREYTNGRLSKITDEDWEALSQYRDDCIKLGTATNKPNKRKAEAAMARAYRERGLKPPKTKIWVVSPLEGLQKVNELSGTKNKWYPPICGAQEIYWLGHWTFVKERFGLECKADPTPQMDYIKYGGGWYWPFEDVVVMAERPEVLKLDNESRLHCEDGPAVSWRDGYKLYYWHGTKVPENWIEDKDNLDPKLALTHPNIEERRCLAEIVGWEKVLTQTDPTLVDKASNPQIGTLYRVDLPDAPGSQFLKVACGTGRTFVLPVPPDMKTALQANAWTYDVPEEVIKNLEVRT